MSDQWRYRCPQGHTNWRRRVGSELHANGAESRYYCGTCNSYGDASPHFDELRDMKNGGRR